MAAVLIIIHRIIAANSTVDRVRIRQKETIAGFENAATPGARRHQLARQKSGSAGVREVTRVHPSEWQQLVRTSGGHARGGRISHISKPITMVAKSFQIMPVDACEGAPRIAENRPRRPVILQTIAL